MAELPPAKPGRLKRFLLRPPIYDVFVGVLAIVGNGIAAAGLFDSAKPKRACFLLAVVVVSGIALIVRGVVQYLDQAKRESTHELEGCLHVLHSILLASLGKNESDPHLRITIHRPINDGQRLEQVLEYVGDLRGGKSAGRTFPAQCGIIGLCLRKKTSAVGTKTTTDYNQFINELVSEWHYTEADAKKLNPATMSWMAIPLTEDEGGQTVVRGVVYFDAMTPNFFTRARETVCKMGCPGIARFVKLKA